MTNHDPRMAKHAAKVAALALMGAAVVTLAGCGSEPPPPVAKKTTAPPPPPPPPAPKVTTIADLMAEMGIDDRVMMTEAKAPAKTEDRRAVLSFFDAFARADADSLKTMMPFLDEVQLDILVESGEFDDTIEELWAIEVEAGSTPEGDSCVLAFFDIDGEQQPQMWVYAETDGAYEFSSQPTPENIMMHLSGTELVQAWFDRWAWEQERAIEADVKIAWDRVNLDDGEGGSSSSSGPSSSPRSPGTAPDPGGGGGRRPTPPPRRPPGPG